MNELEKEILSTLRIGLLEEMKKIKKSTKEKILFDEKYFEIEKNVLEFLKSEKLQDMVKKFYEVNIVDSE